MSFVEMTIDSLLHGMHRDDWLILLKERSGSRCLPVYVDKVWADTMSKILRNQVLEQTIDADIEKMLSIGSDIKLLIVDRGDRKYIGKFLGQSLEIECVAGKALAICANTNGYIYTEESTLDKAGGFTTT